MRFYWTIRPREIEVGIAPIGDFNYNLDGQEVGDGITAHEFSCPDSCSNKFDQPVTVIREALHMHRTGVRMTNE